MRASRMALIALAAGNQRVDGHALPRAQPPDRASFLKDGSRALMPDDPRRLDNLVADAPLGVVVHVGAANPHRIDAQEDIPRARTLRLRSLSDLQLANAGEKSGFHSNPLGDVKRHREDSQACSSKNS